MTFGTEAFELEILKGIQDSVGCSFMDWMMKTFSIMGNGGALWIGITLIMLFFGKYRKTGIMMAAGLILGLIFGNLILKNAVARPRPCWIDESIVLLIENPSDYSFPSGHTLASFVSAFVLLGRDRRLGIPALAVAALIAFSRMYLFVHFPTDILGGLLLALLIYMGMRLFVRLKERKKLS